VDGVDLVDRVDEEGKSDEERAEGGVREEALAGRVDGDKRFSERTR